MFPNGNKMRHVWCPTLILHGTEDNVVPPEHSEWLAQTNPDMVQRLLVPGASHNDIVSRSETWTLISMFITELDKIKK
jgi:pimeloyl-ACP methyl ester carboxylesterase